ncbi:DUF4333 domain-containing protein [Demetria terragena]|uniref:DUF4333 domain-containing protein n=1 Tax=Demetria terragena TaxID=63959 RepID=UPI000379F9A5|nr:DUF4333 domain-containing protein [Demetria terragena]
MPRTRRTMTVAAAALAIALGASGCGTQEADSDQVADELTKALEKLPALKGKDVTDSTCDGSLKAEVGQTTQCEVKVDGKAQKFTAKVSAVNDETVRFNFTPTKK